MNPPPARPLWRLEDLLALCFQPEELHRSLSRMFPQLVPELPPIHECAAQFAHEAVALLERHGSIDAPLFAQIMSARPLRRAQIMSAAFALSIDKTAIERLIREGETTHVFRSPMIVEPALVDALEGLVLERERSSPDDPRRGALSEDIERLAAQIRTRRPVKAGDRISGAILEYLIGRGAFGSVWRSRDAETGAPRATKIFDVYRLTDGIMLWRFRRGIRALQNLNKHRGAPASIAKVYTVSEDGLAFSMEFLPRGSLEEIARRSWTLSQRIMIFSEICGAVAFAHGAGVIHRDIKPANVMFDADLRPVLIDFDIADVQFLTEQKLTSGGLGTPMFASPEQLECAGDVDERADIYSLGRLLHYMLIERVPTYIEQGALLENLSRFPPSLSYTVHKATQRQPDDRFKSAVLLRHQVEAYKTGLAALQANIRRSAHWVRRNVVGLVLASCATTGALLYAKHQEVLASATLVHQRELEDSLAQVRSLTASLDGLQLKLEDARRVQADLSGRLDEAKVELAKLERGETVPGSPDPNIHHEEISTKIRDLEAELRQAEVRLDSVHHELGATLKQLNRVSRNESKPLSRPASSASSASPASPAPPASPASPAPPAPPASPKPVADPWVDANSAPSTDGARSEANHTAKRTRPSRSGPRPPVDLIERQNEFAAKVQRLNLAAKCRAGAASRPRTVGFAANVDADGKVNKVQQKFGDTSNAARTCVERIVRRIKVSPMKRGSRPSVHPFSLKFR